MYTHTHTNTHTYIHTYIHKYIRMMIFNIYVLYKSHVLKQFTWEMFFKLSCVNVFLKKNIFFKNFHVKRCENKNKINFRSLQREALGLAFSRFKKN